MILTPSLNNALLSGSGSGESYPTAEAIADEVRTELTTELAAIIEARDYAKAADIQTQAAP